MGGIGTLGSMLPDLSQQVQQQDPTLQSPPQPPAPPQQQAPPDVSQSPQEQLGRLPQVGQQQPDPIQQRMQQLSQTISQGSQIAGNPNGIKPLLGNFFHQGMGALMNHMGVLTPEQRAQNAASQLMTLKTGQATIEMKDADVAYKQKQLELLQQSVQNQSRYPAPAGMESVGILPGTMITPQEHVQAGVKMAQIRAGMGPMVNLPQNVQDATGLPGQVPLKTATQATGMVTKQEGQIALSPEQAKGFGLPPTVTSLPAMAYARFQSLTPQQRAGGQWVQAGDGTWQFLPTTSTTTRSGVPGIGGKTATQSPQAGGAASPAGATLPGSGRSFVGQGVGRAFDPVSNQWSQVTAAQAKAQGLQQFQPMTAAETDKVMYSQRQFNDVQVNTSRYTDAAKEAINNPPSTADYVNLHTLINKAGPADFKVAVGAGGEVALPGLSAFLEGLSRESKSEGYAALSPQAKSLYDGYVRTLSAVPAYIKGLTNVGRFNEQQLELELRNIADPTYKPQDILRKQQQWQENIDRGTEGMTRVPGLDTINDIRARYEKGYTPPSIQFKEGQDTYNIPASKLPKFRSLHPKAVPVAR